MMILTLATWLLSCLALGASIVALRVALRSSERSHLKRLSELSERFTELDEMQTSHSAALKRLNSRISMQTLREKRANNGESDQSTSMTEADKDEWQRKMNLQLAMRRMGR
jgi:hypothetical protein